MNVAKLEILKDTFENQFEVEKFKKFTREFFNEIDMLPEVRHKGIWREYSDHINSYYTIAKYADRQDNKLMVMAVELKKDASVDRARSMQRNFVSKVLDENNLDAAIVAFYTENESSWRMSFVRLDYSFTDKGITLDLTPARRYSYLVGENEPNHTAKAQLLPIFEDDRHNPTLDEIESAFSIEKVTKEFFTQYKEKYLDLKEYLENDSAFINETKKLGFEVEKFSEQFAKKLMGQLAFLYFLQKKGWLGVRLMPENNTLNQNQFKEIYINTDSRNQDILKKVFKLTPNGLFQLSQKELEKLDEHEIELLSDCFIKSSYNMPWGTGNKNFIRKIFDLCIENKDKNFFNEYLEPFFYNALNKRRKNQYYQKFNCKIPFLNGGLFEPLEGYHWKDVNFEIPNELFSNRNGKNKEADGILDIFDRFNFTMNEDEPLEKEVAIDPEMLGKIFENLLDVSDRKSKGAFYTPREIVHYMCQESLINYLLNEVNVPYEDIKEFILYGELIRDQDNRRDVKDIESFKKKKTIKESIYDNIVSIDRALENVRIADPAVGSGAFPLGMLNEIVRARNNITEYIIRKDKEGVLGRRYGGEHLRKIRSHYKMKLKTIKNCIFAVDIEPSAADITKLRLWLSVVVDQEIDNENLEPHPLPNLDMNIHVGNSLIDEYEGINLFDESILDKSNDKVKQNNPKYISDKSMQIGLFVDPTEELLKRMFELQDRYFDEEDEGRKKQFKDNIDNARDEIIRHKLYIDGNEEALRRYEDSLKKKTKPYFIWELEFAKIFKEKGGFDIVIGNPPYVGEKGNKEIFHEVKATKFGARFYQRRMDYFYFFIAKSIEIMKNKGVLSFITTNYWITASGGKEKFRPYLKEETNILRYIDFGEYKIFDSALGQHNCIFLIEKNTADKEKKTIVTKIDDYSEAKVYSLDNILFSDRKLNGISNFTSQEQNKLYDNKTFNIHFNDNAVFSILKKIQKAPHKLLGDLCIISGGVSSSADKVTNANLRHCSENEILKNRIEKGNGILLLDMEEVNKMQFLQEELNYIKPYFKSSEIEKYITNEIPSKYLIYATHNNASKILNQEKIYNHLLRYKTILENRSQDIELERAMQKGHWFVLTNGRNRIDFTEPKIVCPYRTKDNVFGYNETEWYAGRDVYYLVDITINIKFLLGLLNSKFLKFWLEYKGKKKGDIYEIYPEPLKNIPIIYSNKELIEEIAFKTNQILMYVNEEKRYYGNSKISKIYALEKDINKLVYQLYNLTDSEIKLIDKI